ncbi:MAG: DUF2442 domain-containing protein [Sulfuritalea sp.]|nr:DUF2442 domain-containing protein [Sulfuritalea sp.]
MIFSQTEIGIPNALNVHVSKDALTVELDDGRTLTAPLGWYPRLSRATPEEREHWRLIGSGTGIHWEDIDEDVSVEGLLLGKRSGESQRSFDRWLAQREG